MQSRRPSFPDAASPAEEVSSWRSKLPPRPPSERHQAPEHPSTHPVLPSPATIPAFAALSIDADEEVEVLDFSEHGKLVGSTSAHSEATIITSEPGPSDHQTRAHGRPGAADFFDDDSHKRLSHPPTKPFEGPWRRRTSIVADRPPTDLQPVEEEPTTIVPLLAEKPNLRITPAPHTAPLHRRMSVSSDDFSRSHRDGAPPHSAHGQQPRSPLTPSYREAPMSALDDTMARIKGALFGMQKPDVTAHVKPSVPPALDPVTNWTAPAVRSVSHHDSHEVFDITAAELPKSPKPAWNNFHVHLPSVTQQREPPHPKQLQMTSKAQRTVRTDIYSWNPPIEGMNRRDFQLNDILFPRPVRVKGLVRYMVTLPRNRIRAPIVLESTIKSPIVNLPGRIATQPNGVGAFGRKKEADSSAVWRKPAISTFKTEAANQDDPQTLDTVSRSPPPELPSATKTSQKDDAPPSPTVSVATSVRTRSQPKMPVGTDVAFYTDVSQPKTSVNFIVGSELDDEPPPQMNGEPASSAGTVTNPIVVSSTPLPTVKAEDKKPVVSSLNQESQRKAIEKPVSPFIDWSLQRLMYPTRSTLHRQPLRLYLHTHRPIQSHRKLSPPRNLQSDLQIASSSKRFGPRRLTKQCFLPSTRWRTLAMICPCHSPISRMLSQKMERLYRPLARIHHRDYRCER